jgi:hypothetical protein
MSKFLILNILYLFLLGATNSFNNLKFFHLMGTSKNQSQLRYRTPLQSLFWCAVSAKQMNTIKPSK